MNLVSLSCHIELWALKCETPLLYFHDYYTLLFSINCFACRGTIEDTELIEGLVFDQKTAGYGGPSKVEKARIALIQFCISPPKTDVSVIVGLILA